MQTIDLKFSSEIIDQLFPSEEEGQNVQASQEACRVAIAEMKLPEGTELEWHLPDVFNVRYGSSYCAGARHEDQKVRFHSTEGAFLESDTW